MTQLVATSCKSLVLPKPVALLHATEIAVSEVDLSLACAVAIGAVLKIPTTAGDRNVTLVSNALVGTVPDSFSTLSALTAVNFGQNSLAGTFPRGLGVMSGLQYVHFLVRLLVRCLLAFVPLTLPWTRAVECETSLPV